MKARLAKSYLTDLEIESSPPLFHLKLVDSSQQMAQSTTWFEIHKTTHLKKIINNG
jgi:hypothetical protein